MPIWNIIAVIFIFLVAIFLVNLLIKDYKKTEKEKEKLNRIYDQIKHIDIWSSWDFRTLEENPFKRIHYRFNVKEWYVKYYRSGDYDTCTLEQFKKKFCKEIQVYYRETSD